MAGVKLIGDRREVSTPNIVWNEETYQNAHNTKHETLSYTHKSQASIYIPFLISNCIYPKFKRKQDGQLQRRRA